MKIVVLGASGLVGSHMISAARLSGHQVVGTTRSTSHAEFHHLEIGNLGATIRFLESTSPSVVVYAAGWSWVDGCEGDSDRSQSENLELPLRIARWCASRGVRIVYYSTSYVFDGREGGYAETDEPSPVNTYGRHKSEAEKAILDVTAGLALIPRLICVWGQEIKQKNFVYQVIKAAGEGRALVLPVDQCGNPSWAGDIANWTLRLIEGGEAGLWHLAGGHALMSRPEWARAILRGLAEAGRPCRAELIVLSTAEMRQAALRPLRAGLSTAKAQRFYPMACREPWNLPLGI